MESQEDYRRPGRLKGEGGKVTWDLSGLAEGTYTATVEANDGNQHTAFASTSVTVASCPNCLIREAPCPTIYVSCSSDADRKQPIVFEAIVSGGPVDVKPTYTWSVTGKILSGQGTSKLSVDASEFTGTSITATVSVGGNYHPSCPGLQASCAIIHLSDAERPTARSPH